MSSQLTRVLVLVACFAACASLGTSAQAGVQRSTNAPASPGSCKGAPFPSILLTLPSLNELAFVDPSTQQIEQMDNIYQSPGAIVLHPRRPIAFIATDNNTQILYFDLNCQVPIGSVSLPDGFSDLQIND